MLANRIFAKTGSGQTWETWKTDTFPAGGLQPRGVNITRNLCHEYGDHQKQSSFVFIAKSMWVNVLENVVYNAARAHVNQAQNPVFYPLFILTTIV